MRKNTFDIEHALKRATEDKANAVADLKKQLNELALDRKGLEQKLRACEAEKR